MFRLRPYRAFRAPRSLSWGRVVLALVTVLVVPLASPAQTGGRGLHGEQQSAT
jgi:hypothetical protein